MKTAFEILGVSEQTDDAAVKRAYLQKVKQYPPERAAEQFREIRRAYEALKDARSRIDYQLFHQPEADIDQLLERAFDTGPVTAVDGGDWVKLLQVAVAESLRQ